MTMNTKRTQYLQLQRPLYESLEGPKFGQDGKEDVNGRPLLIIVAVSVRCLKCVAIILNRSFSGQWLNTCDGNSHYVIKLYGTHKLDLQ